MIRNFEKKTFHNFDKLKEVPEYGLTVGLSTIYLLSKKAILVLTGKEKRIAYRKINDFKKFNIKWPASIVFKCKKYKIYSDKLATIK